ncbi:MAG: DUF4293 domain-containing protein [Bacteroidales bacterium]
MLQRPQTIFLLLVSVLAVLLLTGPLVVVTHGGEEYLLRHNGIRNLEGISLEVQTWPMTALFIAMAALSFFNIFSYRNRMRQMRIAIFLIFLFLGSIGMILYYVYATRGKLEGAPVVYQWRIVIPPIAAILTYLAFRRIRRDELLVKAYDRIR